MKALILPLLFFVLASSLSAQNTNDIEVAVATRAKSLATSEAQHRDRVFQFKKTYTTELARQESLVRAKGDLEGLLAIRSESERMDRPLTPPELKALPEAVRASRAKFDQSVARSLAQERAEVAAHDRTYAATLQTVQARLTRAGDIEGALKAKGLLDTLRGGKGSPVPVAPPTPPRAVGATTPAPIGSSTGRTTTGLLLTRYPMHPSQEDGNRYKGYVPYTELGKPLGAPRTVRTVSEWTKPVNENAVVAGLLRIDQPGTYEFRMNSGYDRNELLIDGEIVCKFRDGENKPATVELRAGLLPIVSVGYALSTTDVRVQWKPPGAAEFSDIPSTVFSH